MDEDMYLTKTEVRRKFGLSDPWMEKLGHPDSTRNNLRYPRGPLVGLYSVKRVEEFVACNAEELARSKKRRPPEAIEQERFTKFNRKYQDWANALPDAAHAMLNMNRYAKRLRCTKNQKQEIYDLKNRLIRLVYTRGLVHAAVRHMIRSPGLLCNRCDGSGETPFRYSRSRRDDLDFDDRDCWHCGGTGMFREPTDQFYVCFSFTLGDHTYDWHQPEETVKFEYKLTSTDPPKEIDLDREKPLDMKPSQFAQAKALVRWVLSKEVPTAQP